MAHAGVAASLDRVCDPEGGRVAYLAAVGVVACGAEHVPRIAAVCGTDLESMRVLDRGMSGKGHSQMHTAVAAETAV